MSQVKLQKAASTIRFTAPMEAAIRLPEAASAALSSNGNPMVEGTLHGFPFRAPVEDRSIVLSAALQNAIGAKPGEAVGIELTRFGEEPEVRVPPDFRTAIEASEKARALWPEITPMARREWVRWIASAKQEKTRQKRIEVGIDKLSKGMRRPCCFPGLNFVTKDLVPPEDTWAALPDAKK